MYAALWRLLPGGRVLKLLQVVVMVFLIVAVCFQWVFPTVAPHIPINDNTITE